jgi:K+ transporter
MGWLVALCARLALLTVWLSTPLVSQTFHENWLVPLLGILFLPFTILAYVLVSALTGTVTGGGWLWVFLAFVFDLAAHGAPVSQTAQAGGREKSA